LILQVYPAMPVLSTSMHGLPVLPVVPVFSVATP
jgi:hypothetical protein